jgi:hypothetical protein
VLDGSGIICQVADKEKREPSQATGTAALVAGWSHGDRDVSAGWLRPTLFGAVDGLVINTSLIAGLGGAGAAAHTIVLTGAVSRDPRTARQVHTREELGVDHIELPSPILAGVASSLAFSLGALLPLLPYLVGLPALAVTLAIAVTLGVGSLVGGRLSPRKLLCGPAPGPTSWPLSGTWSSSIVSSTNGQYPPPCPPARGPIGEPQSAGLRSTGLYGNPDSIARQAGEFESPPTSGNSRPCCTGIRRRNPRGLASPVRSPRSAT